MPKPLWTWGTRFHRDGLAFWIYAHAYGQGEPSDVAITFGVELSDARSSARVQARDPVFLETMKELAEQIEIVQECAHGDHWVVEICRRGDDEATKSAWYQGAVERILAYPQFCTWDGNDIAREHYAQQQTRRLRATLIEDRRKEFAKARPDLMLALIERDGMADCAVCSSLEDLTIDHIIPLSRGGTDDLSNLQILCRSCNASKGDSMPVLAQET